MASTVSGSLRALVLDLSATFMPNGYICLMPWTEARYNYTLKPCSKNRTEGFFCSKATVRSVLTHIWGSVFQSKPSKLDCRIPAWCGFITLSSPIKVSFTWAETNLYHFMKNTAPDTMLKNEKKLAHLVCCTCPEGCYRLQIPQAMYYRDC